MKLIDKDAAVAEIKKRRKDWQYGSSVEAKYKKEECDDILSFLDTLEVKEVSLEEEVESWMKEIPSVNLEWGNVADAMRDCAEHFFELGIKSKSSYVCTQNIDDTLKEMGVDPDSKSAESFKEFYYMALEKFKAQKGEKV